MKADKSHLKISALYFIGGVLSICIVTSIYCHFLFREHIERLKSVHRGFAEGVFKELRNDFEVLDVALMGGANEDRDRCNKLEAANFKPYSLAIIQNYKVFCQRESNGNRKFIYLSESDSADDLIQASKLYETNNDLNNPYRIFLIIDLESVKNKLNNIIKIEAGYEYKILKEESKIEPSLLTSIINITKNIYIEYGYSDDYIKKIKFYYVTHLSYLLVMLIAIYSMFLLLFANKKVKEKMLLINSLYMQVKEKCSLLQENNQLLRSKYNSLKKHSSALKKFQTELHSKIKEELELIGKLVVSFQKIEDKFFIDSIRERIKKIQGLKFAEQTISIVKFEFINDFQNLIPEYLEYNQKSSVTDKSVSMRINEITLKQILISTLHLICCGSKAGDKVSFLLSISTTNITFTFQCTSRVNLNNETNYHYSDIESTLDAYLLSLKEIKEVLELCGGQFISTASNDGSTINILIQTFSGVEQNDKAVKRNIH